MAAANAIAAVGQAILSLIAGRVPRDEFPAAQFDLYQALDNSELFVYLRHNRNAWKFDVGRFINPREWSLTSAPQGFSPEVLDMYRSAAASLVSRGGRP